MTAERWMSTSALVRLIARGAASTDAQDAAEAELDRRVPAPARLCCKPIYGGRSCTRCHNHVGICA